MTGEAASWAEWGVVVDRQVWPCATPHIAAWATLDDRPVVRRTVHASTGLGAANHAGEWTFVTEAELHRHAAEEAS